MKRCPECGYENFYVIARVTQMWMVDQDGDFIQTEDDCVAVTHYPNDKDTWICAHCTYENLGSAFNVQDEEE